MRRPYLMKDGIDIKNYFILDFYEKNMSKESVMCK